MPPFSIAQPVQARRSNGLASHYLAIVILLMTSLAFMLVQNSSHAVGGHISLPKALWLDWTLTTFYILPFFLWRNGALGAPVRVLFGWLLISFLLRGVAELIVIYTTHAWRCLDGIAHNGLTLALAAFLFLRVPQKLSAADRRALGFLLIYIATLAFESVNAWQFSLLADPGKGIYFAANTPHFAFVNQLTWMELALLWPWFIWLLWKTHNDFPRP
jgi:hypothetical protein